MDKAEFDSLKLIRDIVDNPLFTSMISSMKRSIADTMLISDKEEDRDRLFSEARALGRLVDELTVMANKYRMIVDV